MDEVEVALTPKQIDVVHFRFLDVGHEWVRLEGKRLIIPKERLDEALDILDTAVDITRDWVYEPTGRAEHFSTVNLYEKVKAAKEKNPVRKGIMAKIERKEDGGIMAQEAKKEEQDGKKVAGLGAVAAALIALFWWLSRKAAPPEGEPAVNLALTWD